MSDEPKNHDPTDADAAAPEPDRPRRAEDADLPEVMTVRQAAEYLQVNEQVLYRYVREGKVPCARMGSTIRFKKSVLDQWLARESWESIGVRLDTAGKPRSAPAPLKPRLEMEID